MDISSILTQEFKIKLSYVKVDSKSREDEMMW